MEKGWKKRDGKKGWKKIYFLKKFFVRDGKKFMPINNCQLQYKIKILIP
jgi:hypothetical protein